MAVGEGDSEWREGERGKKERSRKRKEWKQRGKIKEKCLGTICQERGRKGREVEEETNRKVREERRREEQEW